MPISAFYELICDSLINRVVKHFKRLQDDETREICSTQAKYILDDLTPLHELENLISTFLSTSSTEVNPNNRSELTHTPRTDSTNYRNLSSRIQEQQFLINQIKSVEIEDNICGAKARVLYDHLDKLYDWFVRNQAEIDTRVDSATVKYYQTIASQIQQKIIDKKTKLKKIIASNKPTSNATMESEPSNQIYQADDDADLGSLVKKSIFLVDKMKSLNSEGDICRDKARIIFDHLASLYEIFVSIQMKIEIQIEGTKLDTERKITQGVQSWVIQQQTKLKKIFDSTPAHLPTDSNQTHSTTEAKSPENENESRSTQLTTVNNLIKLFNGMLVSRQGKLDQNVCENDTNSTFDKDDRLGIIKSMKNEMESPQTKQTEICSDLELVRPLHPENAS